MKTRLLAGLVLAAGNIGARAESYNATNGPIAVVMASESKELAQGFEAAFKGLRHSPFTLVLVRGGERYLLEDVRSVKASGGTLAVEIGRGILYVVNAQDVLTITEGNVPKPVASGK